MQVLQEQKPAHVLREDLNKSDLPLPQFDMIHFDILQGSCISAGFLSVVK